MRTHTLSRLLLGTALLSLSFGLQANTITIGDPSLSATGNCDPFGCPQFFGLGTYQQVYAASQFSGESTIDGLTFYDDEVENGAVPAGGTFTLSLSYTHDAPDALGTTSPSANSASGSQIFYSGSLPGLTANTLDFVGTPFAYNPADGNLLLTVAVNNPSDYALTLYLDQASSTAVTTNAYFGTYDGTAIDGGNGTGGLVTSFTVAPNVVTTPEPGSLLLVLAGAGLIAYQRRRHKKLL
jgi:hypothetical protein